MYTMPYHQQQLASRFTLQKRAKWKHEIEILPQWRFLYNNYNVCLGNRTFDSEIGHDIGNRESEIVGRRLV